MCLKELTKDLKNLVDVDVRITKIFLLTTNSAYENISKRKCLNVNEQDFSHYENLKNRTDEREEAKLRKLTFYNKS